MNFTLAELTRIKLEPGEVLAVKLYGDDYDEANVHALQNQLKTLFPNNKIMVFMLPNGSDLQIEAIKGSMELAPEEKELIKQNKELVDALNTPAPVANCSLPASYCGDCGCGKKERIEALKKDNE